MKLGLFFSKNIKFDEVEVILNDLSFFNSEFFILESFKVVNHFENIFCCENEEKLISKSDIILAFGGDGTIIRALKASSVYGKPVFGVNCGCLGFLAGSEKNDLNKIEKILNGEYTVENRLMLECVCEGKKFLSVNDIVIGRGTFSSIAKYTVFKENSVKICSCISDGIIISTPVGSTAYSLSSGGPIVDPDLNCLILTPICPHDLNNRSLVVNSNFKICVDYKIKKNSEINVFVDGEVCFSDNKDGSINIEASVLSAKFVKLNDDDFYCNLEKKIIKNVFNNY